MPDPARQSGALPYRLIDDQPQVLLVTSRDTGRWVIPRGGIEDHGGSVRAAEVEAWEEAGVKGLMEPRAMGLYTYVKKGKKGQDIPTVVEVYALKVTEEARDWPEASERIRRWFPAIEAARLVDEPSLSRLILHLVDRFI